MKKTTNFDAFAQFADARLSKEEMKMIKGGFAPEEFEGGNPGTGGGGTGGGNVNQAIHCYFSPTGNFGISKITTHKTLEDAVDTCDNPPSGMRCLGCDPDA